MIAQHHSAWLSHALEAGIGATLLILLVLAVRKPVARHFGAGIAYALWALPVARLLLPPLPPDMISLLSLGKHLAAPAPAADIVHLPAAAPVIMTANVPAPIAAAGPPVPALTDLPAAAVVPSPASTPLESADLLLLAAGIALAVWAAGALFVFARSLRSHVSFMRVVEREGVPVTGDLETLSIEVAREAGLKRMPRVVTSLISSGPFVTGLFRPAVVLPAWFAEDYSRTEARAAIAHELTHVKRGDLWALQASEIFVALMWFNPLAYIARTAFRIDQEAACDADVLARGHASPHAYGATLVKAVRMQMPARIALTTSLPLTHALKQRLKLMSYPAPGTSRRWIGSGAALLLGTTALACTASVATAGEHEQTQVTIENGTLWLNGEKIDNRQVVLLTDPVEGILPQPPVPPEVHELSRSLAVNVSELVSPEMLGSALEIAGSPEIAEITRMGVELGLMGARLGTEAAFESLDMSFAGKSPAEIEAWAEEFEARMEARSAEIEARADLIEARRDKLEAAIEARNDKLEAAIERATDARMMEIESRIEADAARLEAVIEHYYGDDFNARIKARTNLIPDLTEECARLDLADGETRIIERSTDDGFSVKLACIAGDTDTLRAGRTLSFIQQDAGLSDEEKARFVERATQKRAFLLSPGKPTPPETPAAPD